MVPPATTLSLFILSVSLLLFLGLRRLHLLVVGICAFFCAAFCAEAIISGRKTEIRLKCDVTFAFKVEVNRSAVKLTTGCVVMGAAMQFIKTVGWDPNCV